MATTKLQHREWVEGLAGQYRVPLASVAPKTLDLCVQWGIETVFAQIFPTRKHLFLRSTTISNGANLSSLPGIHFAWARAASYIYNSIERPMRYASLAEIPTGKLNTRVKNFDEDPIIYFYNQQVHVLPSGVTTFTYEWYEFPPNIGAPAVIDSTDDGMPADLKEMIGRAALERLMYMMLGEKDSYLLLDEQVEDLKKAQSRLYDDIFNATEPDPRRN